MVVSERWRPIRDFEGTYEVSDHGRVRRVGGGKGAQPGRILKPCRQRTRSRARGVRLRSEGGVGPWRYIHILVLEAFSLLPRPKGHGWETKFRDGDDTNCRFDNLEWQLASENPKRKLTGRPRRPATPTTVDGATREA